MNALVGGLALAASLALAACATVGQTGGVDVTGDYSGRLVVGGESFDAELELDRAGDRGVRGRFLVREPYEIDGSVEGALVDDLLRITVTYRSGQQANCPGRIEGILNVDAGGEVIEGPATISDCGDSLAGRLSFRR